jgi:hypothetical protein
MTLLWAHFAVSAVFVVAAGLVIGRISGELGERWGLGRAWAGAVLLSFVSRGYLPLGARPGIAGRGLWHPSKLPRFTLDKSPVRTDRL